MKRTSARLMTVMISSNAQMIPVLGRTESVPLGSTADATVPLLNALNSRVSGAMTVEETMDLVNVKE